jgi:hypothetical protein
MPSSPRPAAGAAAALEGEVGEARAEGADAAAEVTARVSEALESVFDVVAGTRARTAALLASLSARGARPATADLAALRPGLHDSLTRLDLVSGMGFVAAPGLLADVAVWLEWWQSGPGGEVRPLVLDLDAEHSAYADYTHWEWFALARDTGRRAVVGPYVDYLCSDEYSLTLSLPVTVSGRFAGVAAADVYLPHFEAAMMPVMQRLPWPACLVNAHGRVAVSTSARYLTGSLLKGVGLGARPAPRGAERGRGAAAQAAEAGSTAGTGYAGTAEGMPPMPCGDIPLLLTRC